MHISKVSPKIGLKGFANLFSVALYYAIENAIIYKYLFWGSCSLLALTNNYSFSIISEIF